MGFLSRAVAVLLAMAFVLAPFHSHDAGARDPGAQVGKSAIALFDVEPDHSDTTPDGLKGECTACLAMKQIEIRAVLQRSDVLQVTESVTYSVTEAERLQRLMAEHFRPPCSARV